MPRGQNISLTISPSISSSVTLSPFSKVLRAFAGKMVKLKNKKIANTPIEYLYSPKRKVLFFKID